MKRAPRILNALCVLLILLAAGCASDRPPSGGPAETPPLLLLESSVADSSTLVSPDRIRLTFSRQVDARKLLYALSITPDPGSYHVTSNGRQADIHFFDPLEKERTYIIGISRKFGLSAPWKLAFATGSRLDTLAISGQAYSRHLAPAGDAFVIAWRMKEGAEPANELPDRSPDYLAEASASGSFTLANMAEGEYLLVAFSDRNGNMRWDRMSEPCAIPASLPVQAGTSEVALRVGGILGRQPGILSCTPLDERHLQLTFGEPLAMDSFELAMLQLVRDADGQQVPIESWYSLNRHPFDDTIVIATEPLERGKAYTLRSLEGAAISFRATGKSPGYRPASLTIQPADGADPAWLDAARPCFGKAALLNFSKPVEASRLPQALTLSAISEGGRTAVPAELYQLDARTWALRPTGGFLAGGRYEAVVDMRRVDPEKEKHARDAKTTATFIVAGPDATGSISGSCKAPTGPVVVEARAPGAPNPWRTLAKAGPEGTFSYSFPALPPGTYAISAFIPSETVPGGACRQRWNPGSVTPLRPADPFGIHPAHVRLRAQWALEEIDLSIAPEAVPPTKKITTEP